MSNFEVILALRNLKDKKLSFTDDEYLAINAAIETIKRVNRLKKLVRRTAKAFWSGFWACFVIYTIILVLFFTN